jgi:hypothetical protein
MGADDTGTPASQPGLTAMRREFRVAKQRQLVRLGIKLWNRTEAQHAFAPAKESLDDLEQSSKND